VLAPKNDRARPVTRLCLSLEIFRRTDDGRVRDAAALLDHFFPRDGGAAQDRLFLHLPKEVRADLLAGWGIRGKKSALRDDDEKVRATIADALAAGDIDAAAVEERVTPELLVDWAPLEDWWTFWRGSALPAPAVRRALAVARELALFDDRWLLEHVALRSPKLTGTDVICAALSKEQVVAWVQAVHASGDATPAGLVRALGWEALLAKTAHEALLAALDALARHVGLAKGAAAAPLPKGSPAVLTTAPEIKTAPVSARTPAILSRPPPLPSATSTPPTGRGSSPSLPAAKSAAAAAPPNARSLFGAPPSEQDPAGGPLARMQDPAWAPPRAEPGDMGWDLVHGVQQPMPNNVTPKYELDVDEEPTELLGSDRGTDH
jgi:hypothetical protein